ncbi:hypothetical protein [Anaerotignum propionicum]|uniref:hypothetical protein n=1 Tax=Anaerotignum propionicum TaxID=28446 RepID=UPI00210C2A10|nr:hypothetical protein [Anaerotignum propionicum]MCQ4935946.1 hypothetical protein [Anaerotignum propionicum]
MIKKIIDKIILLILTLAVGVTSLPTSVFANQGNSGYTQSKSITEKEGVSGTEYISTVKNKTTGEIKKIKLIDINNTGIITEDFISDNLNKEFTLINLDIKTKQESRSAQTQSVRFISPETLFDIGCLVISATEFYANPSVWGAMTVIFDGASVALPFVPSVSGVKRLIKASSKLQDSLEYGIRPYKVLKNESSVMYPAHHIMPKKFADRFGLDGDYMFAMIINRSDHIKITSKFNQSKYGLRESADSYSRSYIIRQSELIYKDLYNETGDEIFEFMRRFISESSQYGV